MTKISPKPKKWPKYPETYKMTKMPLKPIRRKKMHPKPKKWPKSPLKLKNDQNTP